jgi:hypothetical protein
MRTGRFIALAGLAMAAACDVSTGTPADAAGDASEVVADVTMEVQDVAGDSAGCEGNAPFCVEFCGSDYLPGQAACVDGKWKCPAPWVLIKDCPPNTCWGPPTPGEVCGPDGWECKPDQNAWELCPDLMCPECTAFEGPKVVGWCACSCEGGYVKCTKVPGGEEAEPADLPPEDVPDVPDVAEDVPDVPDAPPDAPVDSWADLGPLPSTLTLDPATLTFFGLPIGSIRFAVSGLDPAAHACVTLVWDYSNNDKHMGSHCDDFTVPGFPYVIVKWGTDGPCGYWDYWSGLTTVSALGCVDWGFGWWVGQDLVDVEVKVEGAGWTGTIVADNRHSQSPVPASLGIKYSTDVPESVWVQLVDDHGVPAWVTITKDGQPVAAFKPCDVPECGKEPGACTAEKGVLDFTGWKYQGEMFVTWDGNVWTDVPDTGCVAATPAAPGAYEAEFCFGWQVDEAKTKVLSPWCKTVPFTWPTDMVVYAANMGG